MARRADYGFDDVPGASYDVERRRRERRRTSPLDGGGPGRGDAGLMRMMLLFGVICAIVVGRLFYFQIIESSALSAEAERYRTRSSTLYAKRGTIYDRNGNILAVSVDCTTIQANPQQINDAQTAARLIAEALGGHATDFITDLTKSTSFVYVRRQVDSQVASSLQDKLESAGITGIEFVPDIKREYPYGNIGAQVLGIVGVDGDGLSGLELYYDSILRGTDGVISLQMGRDNPNNPADGMGATPIAGVDNVITPAQDGADIVLGLDIEVQRVVEEQIVDAVKNYEADSGTVVVTDPQTGEIIAACSTPLLNLNDLANVDAASFALKPVSSSYEPGSIFKILTAAIGIDAGLINANSTWTVPPRLLVGDDYVGDVDERDYTMDMSLREIMRRSSNVGMALIAQEVLGGELFSEGLTRFRIGQLTGIDFPGESVGIVRSLAEYDGSTLGNMAFGQGLALPMMQMVEAVGSIANGGQLITPHFLVSQNGEDVAWESVGTSVSPETCAEVVDILRTVVDEGTAMNAAVEGYDVAAKTGTGQQIDEEHGGYLDYSYMSSLIGFANASDPHVLVYVGLNGTAYHGSAVGKVFSAIMSEALIDGGIQPVE